MAKNDEVDQTNLGVSSADIPDLKKKDKERKRTGMAWSGARAPGGTFQGARAAASAASSAAGGAQAGAGLLAKIAALSLMGKISAVMAAVVVLGGAGLVATALRGGGAVSPGTGSFSLGGITSSVKVRSGGSDRIGVAGKGEIAFDPVEKAKPAEKKAAQDKTVEASPAAAAPAPSPADMAKEAKEAQGKLAHNMSGAQLSGSLGGQFGGKNIFSGSGSSAPKFGENAAKYVGKGGKLTPMRPGGVRATASGRSTSRGRTSRALGQLRIAKGLSTRGAGSTSVEGASGGATDAFEQNAGDGGNLTSNGSATGGGTAATPAGGGGGGSGGAGNVTVPDTITIDDVQDALDKIKDLTNQANDLKSSGNLLLIIGGVVTAIGIGLACSGWPWCLAIGLVLICIGLGIMMAGYSKLQQSDAKKKEAEEMGNALSKRTGEFQSKVVRECVEQAIAGGTSLDTCRSVEAEERTRLVEEQKRKALERQKEISAETPETF